MLRSSSARQRSADVKATSAAPPGLRRRSKGELLGYAAVQRWPNGKITLRNRRRNDRAELAVLTETFGQLVQSWSSARRTSGQNKALRGCAASLADTRGHLDETRTTRRRFGASR